MEFYERQEQREADRPELKVGFSFTRWLDKSGKPIEDHSELPTELQETTILKKQSGVPVEILLKSKLVRERLKAKGYDLEEVESGKATDGEDLVNLLQKLAKHKPRTQPRGMMNQKSQ